MNKKKTENTRLNLFLLADRVDSAFVFMAVAVRIVLTDHYLTSVNGQFDPIYSKLRHPIRQIPIIRIFGPNDQGTFVFSSFLLEQFDFVPGKKVCLHLHGVFPYLLVKSPTDEFRYGEQLAQSLDLAINLTFEKGDQDAKHVYNIQLVQLVYDEIRSSRNSFDLFRFQTDLRFSFEKNSILENRIL